MEGEGKAGDKRRNTKFKFIPNLPFTHPTHPTNPPPTQPRRRFVEGEGKAADKRRNTKFKLIPNVVKGSWIVRQSVGTTPVLLGQKLLTRYFRCVYVGWGGVGGSMACKLLVWLFEQSLQVSVGGHHAGAAGTEAADAVLQVRGSRHCDAERDARE